MLETNNEKGINFENTESKQNDMTYYRTRQEAEAHRTQRGERIYYEAGKGWYIIRPQSRENPFGRWPW